MINCALSRSDSGFRDVGSILALGWQSICKSRNLVQPISQIVRTWNPPPCACTCFHASLTLRIYIRGIVRRISNYLTYFRYAAPPHLWNSLLLHFVITIPNITMAKMNPASLRFSNKSISSYKLQVRKSKNKIKNRSKNPYAIFPEISCTNNETFGTMQGN